MDAEPFLQPRLTGARFEGGVIPLHVLADLAVLEEMLVEIAKAKYKEARGRSRVPNGFVNGISLKLAGVNDGSAIAIIKLVIAATALGSTALPYFEEAKGAILGAIGAAERDERITAHLPQNLLGYFDRFGRSLESGEAIEFTELNAKSPVRLTQETRRKLVLASSVEEVTDEVVLHGTIPEADQQTNTFHLRLLDGTKVKAPLTRPHYDAVVEAFNNYRKGQMVRLHASGRFNRAKKLQDIESVEHVYILDPLDIDARLSELRLLRHGWLDGKGVAPPPSGLDWVSEAFGRHYPDDLPLPYLYPTAEGAVRAEWSLNANEVSLEIDLEKKLGVWHVLNLNDDTDLADSFPLDALSGWQRLVIELRQLAGTTA